MIVIDVYTHMEASAKVAEEVCMYTWNSMNNRYVIIVSQEYIRFGILEVESCMRKGSWKGIEY